MNFLKLLIKLIINSFLFSLLFFSTLTAQDNSTQPNSTIDTTFVMQKSPWGAVARSAILPGLGQFYNESYWKIPIIWGFAGWFIYEWIQNNDLYKTNGDLYIQTGEELYRTYRDFYRDQRDNFTIYLVAVYLLNLIDAYVDAHLYDFNIDEDISTGALRMNFRYNF